MKVPLPWLKEYISTQLSADEIAETLTLTGLEVEGIENDVFEVALTPNLAHCASIRGIARELAAITEEPLHMPKFELAEKGDDPISKVVSIIVKNRQGCPRYACRLIRNVRVAPSPAWLKERIEACGLKSINNVVDVTNFVLLELGQPLHAFDFDRLDEGCIIVRNAQKGERVRTLDGKEHELTEENLVICDAKKPVAIAGIMGSLQSEISDQTQTILLESAYFEPSQIRRTSKKLGIHSEASYRFERGTDPNGVIAALERAAALICDITGGYCLREIIDIKQHAFPKTALSCRLSRANQLLGTHLAMSEVETLFRRLDFTHAEIHDDQIRVHIPTYRHDIHQEIDLIEEIARLYGYGNLQKEEKPVFRTGDLPDSPEYVFGHEVRSRLVAEGLQEFLTCDLISPTQAALISPDNFPTRSLIKLLNPHSIEQSILRPSMLPGLLSVIKYNADHSIYTVSGFELGRVHFTSKERYFEATAAAIVLTGERNLPIGNGMPILSIFLISREFSKTSFKVSKFPILHFYLAITPTSIPIGKL